MRKHIANIILIWAILLLAFLTYAVYRFYQTNVQNSYLLNPEGMNCYKLYV